MQIVYLNFDRGIPVLGDKGGSVHVRAVVTALARLGHDVTLLCSTPGQGNAPPPARLIELPPAADPGALAAQARRLGLPAVAAEEPTLRRELATLAHDATLPDRARATLAAHGVRPDLIYERHALFHTAGAALAHAFDVPRVLEVNAPLAEEQERFRGLVLRDLARAQETASWRAAGLVVAVSQEMRARLLAAGVPAGNALVVPNGVDTKHFQADPAGGAATRRRWRLGDDPVIGFIGSFKAWHGVDFLLAVLARVRRQCPQARLLAVGDGPGLTAARALAQQSGLGEAVVFTGAVPHAAIPAHLAAMDLTVAPYAAQPGFYFSPLKVVESLAAGRPVVAPAIGQIETLIADGGSGLLYPPDDAPACADAVLRLLRAPALRDRLGAQAMARARAAWDWTALVGRVLDQAAALTLRGAAE